MGKFGSLSSPKKASCNRVVLPNLNFKPNVCRYLCDHTTGCEVNSFTADGNYGIVHVRQKNGGGGCRTHEGGSDTNKSTQGWTRRGIKTAPHPDSSGGRTDGLWSNFWRSDHWAMSSYAPPPLPQVRETVINDLSWSVWQRKKQQPRISQARNLFSSYFVLLFLRARIWGRVFFCFHFVCFVVLTGCFFPVQWEIQEEKKSPNDRVTLTQPTSSLRVLNVGGMNFTRIVHCSPRCFLSLVVLSM